MLALATWGGIGIGSANAAEPNAVVRAAHFSPTTPGVDVYLGPFSGGGSKLWLSGVSYGAVSPYQSLKPGLYTVAMRVHGAPSSTPPTLSWTLNAAAGQAYTVAGVGAGSSVRGLVLHDSLTAPPAGSGRIRVVQAASRAPQVTVVAARGPVIARDASFATTTSYAIVPAGRWAIKATVSGSSLEASATVDVTSGAISSVLVLDAKGSGITVRAVVDANRAGTVPRGPVPAGGGGTAVPAMGGTPGGLPFGLVALLFLTAAGGLLWTGRRWIAVTLPAAVSTPARHRA
ncbi:MAG: DUF4397 domain-containing protein [Jatrophihabitans sp.]